MLFDSPQFFFFFIAVFAVHWAIPSHRIRKLVLLVASYAFYAGWGWKFCFLILFSTLIDYFVGLVLRSDNPPRGRKFWVTVSVVANLGFLGFFKYYNFFMDSFDAAGFPLGLRIDSLILPIGISFYTFQSMSYTIDVYRRKFEPISGFTDFALYVSFFPQLVAGPIVRATNFLPQLAEKKHFNDVAFKSALLLFVIGMTKKAVIADNIAAYIDPIFITPVWYDAASLWMTMFLYSIQLYCDFSGYSDMAIATAGLLGYKLTQNFNFPYFARNVRETWTRWHISLSTWMRDYLYVSLGGGRGSNLSIYRNIFITTFLSGLWHGAGWNMVAWGGLHGIALTGHRLWRTRQVPLKQIQSFASTFAIPITFYWWLVTLIIFRNADLNNAWIFFKAFVFFSAEGEDSLNLMHFLWFPLLGVIHWISMRVDLTERVKRVPDLPFAFCLGAAVALILVFVRVDYRPFVYFQF